MNNRIIILFLFILFGMSTFAQKQKVKNQPYGDQRLYHFGFNVGFHFQDLILTNSGYTDINTGETWFAEIPNYTAGLSVGLITDMYLNQYMSLRVTPSLHFGDKTIMYKEETLNETSSINVRSSYLTLPVDIKFNSMRLNNYRPYFLAGAYTSMDLGRKKGQELLLNTTDYGLEVGLGCDFYLPFVKVCPEVKFCFGLKDLIDKDRSDLTDDDMRKYTQALSKGTSRMIIITLNFE